MEDTVPYPWPYDGRPDATRLALLLVGCQGWWAVRTVDAETTMKLLEDTATSVREAGGAVVWVRTTASGIPGGRPARGPLRGAEDWELVPAVSPADLVIDSPGLNAFFGSTLDADLRLLGKELLAVGGLGLETTIYSTVTGANDRGYECLTLADASAPHEPAVAERAVCSITMSGGIFGAVGSADSLCKSLDRRSV